MATVDRPLAKPRTGDIPDTARPVVKPPKPFFLRSWFGLAILVIAVAAHVYGWQKAEIDPVKLVAKAPDMQRIIGQILQPDIIAHDQAQLQIIGLQVIGSA